MIRNTSDNPRSLSWPPAVKGSTVRDIGISNPETFNFGIENWVLVLPCGRLGMDDRYIISNSNDNFCYFDNLCGHG